MKSQKTNYIIKSNIVIKLEDIYQVIYNAYPYFIFKTEHDLSFKDLDSVIDFMRISIKSQQNALIHAIRDGFEVAVTVTISSTEQSIALTPCPPLVTKIYDNGATYIDTAWYVEQLLLFSSNFAILSLTMSDFIHVYSSEMAAVSAAL